jgi:signal peptide peptidase SppA
MNDAFHLAASRPWLIQRESLETILAIADRCGDPEALQTRLGRPLDNARAVQMRDGVAVIPVTGPIFRYANLFTEISGATATGVLARDIQTALDNPYVRGIVLNIDSPGGDANGINELAKLIADSREIKPIAAYIGGTGASGAYWFASAASEIVIDDTAILGSIGVVMSYLDTRKRDEKSDVRQVEIVSSQSPDKRIDPNTEEGRAKVQALVDALADAFVTAVAQNRGVSADTVLNDFGRGGVLVGAAAVRAGMADRIGSLESLISELAGPASTSSRKTLMSTSNTKGQVTVATTADLRAALAAGYTSDQITFDDNASAVAEARAAGVEEGRKGANVDAVKAERGRIAKLQTLARPGFDAELKKAIDDGESPEAFALALLTAAADRGITLDALRRDAPPAASHANPPNDSRAAPSVRSATDIFAARRKALVTPAGAGR